MLPGVVVFPSTKFQRSVTSCDLIVWSQRKTQRSIGKNRAIGLQTRFQNSFKFHMKKANTCILHRRIHKVMPKEQLSTILSGEVSVLTA